MKLKKDDDTKLSKSHAITVVLSLSLIILRELPHFGGILKYMLNIHITEIMRKKILFHIIAIKSKYYCKLKI